MKFNQIIIPIIAVSALTGCTIDRRTMAPETSVATTAPPAPLQTTTEAPRPIYDPEMTYVDAIRSIHDGEIYVTDQDLIDTGWAVCNGARNGATMQDMSDNIAATATDEDSYNLLTELTVAALMFLCPQYQYLLDQPVV